MNNSQRLFRKTNHGSRARQKKGDSWRGTARKQIDGSARASHVEAAVDATAQGAKLGARAIIKAAEQRCDHTLLQPMLTQPLRYNDLLMRFVTTTDKLRRA